MLYILFWCIIGPADTKQNKTKNKTKNKERKFSPSAQGINMSG